MAMASICCRSPLPFPDHPRSSSSANSIQTLWTGNEGWSRRRSVLGLASMAIAFEFVDLAGGIAPAIEEPSSTVDSKYEKGVRWSEKRMCPQWRQSSRRIFRGRSLDVDGRVRDFPRAAQLLRHLSSRQLKVNASACENGNRFDTFRKGRRSRWISKS